MARDSQVSLLVELLAMCNDTSFYSTIESTSFFVDPLSSSLIFILLRYRPIAHTIAAWSELLLTRVLGVHMDSFLMA